MLVWSVSQGCFYSAAESFSRIRECARRKGGAASVRPRSRALAARGRHSRRRAHRCSFDKIINLVEKKYCVFGLYVVSLIMSTSLDVTYSSTHTLRNDPDLLRALGVLI